MKFKTVYKKGNKYLAKIIFDDVGEKWCSTTSAVLTYAQKNFEEDEEVDVEYTVKNGQYFVSKIKKLGESGGSKKSTSSKSESSEETPTCEDCGAELKDGKYKKCYTCNKKNPVKTKSSYSGKDNIAIQKESVLRSCCEALKVMTGQIDEIGTVGDLLETLYDRMYKKLFG